MRVELRVSHSLGPITVMYIQARFVVSTFLIAAFCFLGIARAQTGETAAAGLELQRHYNAAQSLQQAGKLDEAAQEYRLFLSRALSELAIGESHVGKYDDAVHLFESALALAPQSVAVRLDYAQASLDSGALAHAESLSRELLSQQTGDPKELAQAHEILGRALLKMNRDRDARNELEAAMALDPSFDHGYNLAVACLNLDDANCATGIFSKLEATYGDTPQLHMDFGRAWGESDFQPNAEKEFSKVIAEDPRFPEAHYCLAATYLQENESAKLPAAEAELEKELNISPRDFLTYAALGKLAATQQRYSAAEKYLNRAIQLKPDNPDAYLYLGQLYFNTNRSAAAETALRQAIRLTKDPSRNHYQIQKAHYLLARALMRKGQQKEAAAEMALAQQFLQDNFVQDKNKMSGLLGNNSQGVEGSQPTIALNSAGAETHSAPDPSAARRLADYRKQIAPAVADSYNNLGAIEATNKDYAGAESYFQSAAQWNPSIEGIDLNLGRAAFSASRFGDAVPPLTRYLRAHPESANIRAVLGVSQFMVKDYRACVATLRPVIAQLESTPQIAYVYADSLLKTGQRDAGIARLAALEKQNADVADVHRALGEAYMDSPDKQRSIEELRMAVRLDAANVQGHRDLGEALLAAGDAKAAIPELESATRLAPDDPDSHRELARAYSLGDRDADAARELHTVATLRQQRPPQPETTHPHAVNEPSASPEP